MIIIFINQRGIYETNARIEGQGADAEGYDLAVGSNNQIDQLANILDERSIWQRYGL